MYRNLDFFKRHFLFKKNNPHLKFMIQNNDSGHASQYNSDTELDNNLGEEEIEEPTQAGEKFSERYISGIRGMMFKFLILNINFNK